LTAIHIAISTTLTSGIVLMFLNILLVVFKVNKKAKIQGLSDFVKLTDPKRGHETVSISADFN